MKNFSKKCNICNALIYYRSKQGLEYSLAKKSNCRKCSQLLLNKKGKIKSNIPNVNDKFDYWTVTDNTLIEMNKGNWGVKCTCKCGTERYVRIHALYSRRSKGCECRNVEINKKKVNCIGEISKTFWSRIQKSAKIRNISFNISREYSWNLYLNQNKKCALSGLNIIIEKSLNRNKGFSNITASLDRIDSSLGYTENNIQWVHKDINKMKQDLNEDYFKNLCKLITIKWEH